MLGGHLPNKNSRPVGEPVCLVIHKNGGINLVANGGYRYRGQSGGLSQMT